MPDTADVSGRVTVDGQPVEGVEVHFVNGEFDGYGKTDSQGRYFLVQGAVAGKNQVYFSKIETGGVVLDPEAGMDEGQLAAAAEARGGSARGLKVGGETLPPQFSDPAKSKITFVVPQGGANNADFRISSK